MDDQKQRLIQLFNSRYGSFLHTVRFSSYGDHLCPICGGIKQSHYAYCAGCAQLFRDMGGGKLPIDYSAFGFYAVEGKGQYYTAIHDYKEPTGRFYYRFIELMLRVDVTNHLDCVSRLAGTPVTGWANVPSSKSSRRYGQQHPFEQLVSRAMPEGLPHIQLEATNVKTRKLQDNAFILKQSYNHASLRHVILIDDSWVTGGSIESAALTLKRAGAHIVSSYCCARIISSSFIENTLGSGLYQQFLHFTLFIADWCPWHRKTERTE